MNSGHIEVMPFFNTENVTNVLYAANGIFCTCFAKPV